MISLNFKKVNLEKILFIAACIIGILHHIPQYNYQWQLSQGDHGLNLYAAQSILQGMVPYRDFHWFYGPLMPYVHALALLIFGETIKSFIITSLIFKFATGLVVIRALKLFIHPAMAIIAGLWYWTLNIDCFYTYNHVGGIFLGALVFYYILKFLKEPSTQAQYAGLFCLLIISLIKMNYGIVLGLAFFVCIGLIHFVSHKRSFKEFIPFCLLNLCIVPFTSLIIHAIFLYPVPYYNIRQCFALLGDDPFMNNHPGMLVNAKDYAFRIFKHWTSRLTPLILYSISLLSVLISIIHRRAPLKIDDIRQSTILHIYILYVIFYIAILHEFLLSGIPFRTVWTAPLDVMIIFLPLGLVLQRYLRKFILIPALVIGCIAIMQMKMTYTNLEKFKQPVRFFPLKRAGLFIENNPAWNLTVFKTTQYLEENLNDNELFFSYPYDPIYYYLTHKKSPTRQLVYYQFLNIPEEEERLVIRQLEENKVNWILESNRTHSKELGIGDFGTTHCKILHQYIQENFEEVKRFGNWKISEGGWAWNHGTKILKRK